MKLFFTGFRDKVHEKDLHDNHPEESRIEDYQSGFGGNLIGV